MSGTNGSSPPQVAYLGPKASYSHQATAQTFPEANHTLLPHPTIESIFTAVQTKTVSHGVVPFENSTNGPVAFTLDLLADTAARHREILVCGEIYLPVVHCLVGYSKGSTSGETPANGFSSGESSSSSGKFSHIKSLSTHPQAWGQCKQFLSAHFSHLPETSPARKDSSSTSRAAEQASLDPTRSSAAIASALAAQVNGLEILAEGIQDDSSGNCTRFLIIRHVDSLEMENSSGRLEAGDGGEEEDEEKFKSLVLFSVAEHGTPGALADSLAGFKTQGVSLTSINSRPSGLGAWRYVFFVEVVGRRRRGGRRGGQGDAAADEDGPLDRALVELDRVAGSWRWLGSWRDGGLGGR